MSSMGMYILVCLCIVCLGIGVYGFFKEDGHKKLVAKFVRFVESRKRKKRRKKGI